MPFLAGVFSRTFSAVSDAAAGIKISSTHFDTLTADIATGLSTCLLKDGTQTVTANIPFANFQLTGVGSATARTAAPNGGQVQDSAFLWGGTAAGAANALTITLAPAIAAYAAGQIFWLITGASANTATVTIAVNGLATKAIQRGGQALVANDLPASTLIGIFYDGTAFQLIPAIDKAPRRVNPQTSTYAVLAADNKSLIYAASGTFTITFPTVASLGVGFTVGIKNAGSGVVTVAANGADLIDGAASITLAQNQSVEIEAAAANVLATTGAVAYGASTTIPRFVIVTTTANATSNVAQACNTSSAAFTLTLPASPTAGDSIPICDVARTFDTKNLTVGRNSKSIGGVSEDMTCDLKGASFVLVYDATNTNWVVA